MVNVAPPLIPVFAGGFGQLHLLDRGRQGFEVEAIDGYDVWLDVFSDANAAVEAACAAADVERVRALREDCWDRDRESWARAALDYHKERAGRISLLDEEPRR
jgi:hypothetical protein